MLQGKVVIVTGASSGIGEAAARAFFREGCFVMMAARNAERLREIQRDLSTERVACCTTDVTSENDCRKLADETVKTFGKVDILINNAGLSMRALFAEVDLRVIRHLMEVNFWGTVYCTRYALPEILKNKGSIVGVSSVAGYKGLPGRTGYSASKFAMQGFLEALRVENLKTGIHVLIVCPGYTASNIRKTALNRAGEQQNETPLDESRLMSADEVARHIVHGIKRKKRTIILTAQGRLTVWLNKFFPAWIDRMAYKVIAREKKSPFK